MDTIRITFIIIFTFTTFIINSQSRLIIQNTEDFIHAIIGEDYDNDGNTCETIVTLINKSIMPDDYRCMGSKAKWEVTIDLWGDGTADLQYTHQTYPDDDTFDDTIGNGIPDVYLAPTEIGEEITIVLPEIDGIISNHRVDWKLIDACYNVRVTSTDFMVIDKSPPIAVLKSEFVIDYSTSSYSETPIPLHVDSLNLASYDNCPSSDELFFSFSEDINDKTLKIGCDHIIDTLTVIDVFVWDSRGNYTIGHLDLYVYDPNGYVCIICNFGQNLFGIVSDWKGEPLEGVEITIDALVPEYPKSTLTDELGRYEFYNIYQGIEYTVRASKIGNYTPELTLINLIKLQNHILGVNLFDSPFQSIAADINSDFKLNVNDLLLLRKIALRITGSEPTINSWKFIPSSHEFADPNNPFLDLSENSFQKTFINFNNTEVNFIGIKMGDF